MALTELTPRCAASFDEALHVSVENTTRLAAQNCEHMSLVKVMEETGPGGGCAGMSKGPRRRRWLFFAAC